MDDRIKLAEAMGWKRIEVPDGHPEKKFNDFVWANPEGWEYKYPPDPFTDANDDYAVLEWTRSNKVDTPTRLLFQAKLRDQRPLYRPNVWNYRIGDYARAALKVRITEYGRPDQVVLCKYCAGDGKCFVHGECQHCAGTGINL